MHIFISYSKKNKDYAQRLKEKLLSEGFDVWIDDRIDYGDDWWRTIVQAIRNASAFVVIMSNESDSSEWVQREVTLADKYHIPPFPLWLSGDFHASDNWAIYVRTQFADVRNGDLPQEDFYVRLAKASPPKPRPGEDVTPSIAEPMLPNTEPELVRELANPPRPDTITLPTSPSLAPRSPWFRRPIFLISLIALIAIVLVAIVLPSLNLPVPTLTPATNVALNPSVTSAPTQPKATSTPTITVTPAPTLTPTPSLEIAFVVQTLDKQATVEQATKNAQSTDAARATAYAVGTQSIIDQTATATRWTATATPNITASIEAYRNQQAATATANFLAGLTATAILWTSTPTPSSTPTDTLTPTISFTPSITPTPTATPIPVGFSGNPVTKNSEWTPQYQTFNGVEMALVPVGCFMMGSNDGNIDAKPINQQCFDEPFWIDHYEVTNKQYGSFGRFKGDNRPRDSVSWIMARDFCATRSSRLPTEREWEYAARGPDNLVYSWGNDFVADNVVFSDKSSDETANVGSRPAGDSWVGASDLSGNIFEWVSSLFLPYPYVKDDGREVDSNNPSANRVIRGGSIGFSGLLLRGYHRYTNPADENLLDFGFRCARDY